MTTVVPSRFKEANSFSSRSAMSGSTLPVGSSATRISGRLMTARAMATHDHHLLDRVPDARLMLLDRGRLVDPVAASFA